jgi:uncharacterized protein YnzC (UPF0291/DUF896 family)
MKDQVLKIVKEEIDDKMSQIRSLPINNTEPNTKLHFLTAELGAMQQILRRMEKELSDINRVEVIDENGRSYTNYLKEDQSVNLSVQDDGHTLKVFIERDS